MEHQHSNAQVLKHSLSTFILSLFIVLLCACSTTKAQTYTIDNGKSIKLFEKAQEMYQTSNFVEAEKLLKQALEREPNFVEASTLLGYVYLDKRQYIDAKKQFARAIEINPTAIPNNLFFLAELELKDGEYEKAQKLYQTFLNAKNVNPDMLGKSNSSLDRIHFALQAKSNPIKFEPKNLGPNINSEHAEYFPCITVDQNTLLYTRRLPFEASPQGYNEDFFVAERKEGEWQKAYNIQRPINTEFNEGAPTLSPDGQVLIFTACELYGDYGAKRRGHGSCDLFYAAKDGKNWTNPVNLGVTINSKHWETQPSYSADGRTLFFVRGIRDRSGSRQGDIYTSTLNEDSYWTKPTKLNRNINTPLNEESVFIHPDGKTLYFSSNGHRGMGGLDIFVSKKENGEWGKAINLGYPINTHKNENSLLVSADGKTAYFASDREDGYGDLDLYSFELDESIAPEKVTYFAGKIYDAKTKQPLSARFQLLDLESGELIVESFSNSSNGEFLVTLPAGKNYALNASKDNYLFYSENFALKESKDNEPVQRDVPLQPIEIGKKIVLKNIFFESAKFDLKENSKVELDKLVDFLKKNPKLKIEIGGHTDNLGNPQSNLDLSKNRAKAVFDYLIKAEIAATRMRSTGYGPTKPIESNDTEEGRAKNRRTEFEIVGM